MTAGSGEIGPPAMEADEALKGKTDCVYFLASPLTCKKGSGCEFRHSDVARLNPRDCWYWLNGNCLNPACPFRHPPLEGFTNTQVDPVNYTSVPTTKSNIPCFFYFNAYCNKGNQCPYMHDPFSTQRLQKQASDFATIKAPETKTSTGSDTGPATVEVQTNPLEGTSNVIKHFNLEQHPTNPVPVILSEDPSPSAESSMPECEEPAVKLAENPLPDVEYLNDESNVLRDQSSEELVEEGVEADEWWESSPGFDVLVDDGSEQIDGENDADYSLAHERDPERLHSHLFQYDYEGSAGYDPLSYSDAQYYDDIGYDYDQLDERFTPEYHHRVSEPSRERERIRERTHRHKRKPINREHEMVARDGGDLRDHLRKRRRMDVPRSSRSLGRGLNRHRSRERRVRHPPNGRLAPAVVTEINSARDDNHRQNWSEDPQSSRHAWSGLRDRESSRRRHVKPLPAFPEFPKGLEPKVERSTVPSANFTGPKTLAQIREEKSRTKTIDNNSGDHGTQLPKRAASYEFEGPKPLTELLKDKRKPLLSTENTNNSAIMPSDKEHHEHTSSQCDSKVSRSAENREREYENEFMDDEDDDDEDGLRKKLAHIFPQ